MASIGSASLQIIPSFDGMQGYLERGTSGPLTSAGTAGGLRFGDAAGRSAGSRFGSLFSSAARASLVGALGAGALAFKIGKDSVESASSLAESINAVNVAYGKQGKYVQGLANSAAKLNGVSNREYNEFAVRFSAFSQTIAGSKGFESVRVLDEIGDRATDFASVFNTDVNEALTLFQSGLAGETEPLRRYGIDLSAAAVEAYALSEGIVKNKDDLNEAAKVQARYQLLMEQTSKVQGDFANTSDSLANRQRILSARWEDARAKLGAGLLPILEDVTGFLIDEGVPAFEKFAEWFSTDGVERLKEFGGFVKAEVVPVMKDLAGFAGDAAEMVGKVVKVVNDLPDPAKVAALGGVLGGGAFLKLRGGGGLTGSVGSALGLAKPIPVIVTNWPPGLPGATGGKTPIPPAVIPPGAKPPIGTLPKLAPFIPVGLDSNPGSNSAMYDLFGVGLKSDDEMKYLPLPRNAAIAEWAFTLVGQASQQLQSVWNQYDLLPKKLVTELETNGVPESIREAKALVNQYDLTPKEKRTLFELLGYEQTVARARNINRELDYAARDRRTQITVEMNRQGYQTSGGLQEGTYGQSNFDRAVGRMGE